MFDLPIDIQRLIFAFDATYRNTHKCILYELEFMTPFWIVHPENISQQYYHTPTFKKNKACLYHKQAENLINFNHQSFPTRTTDLNCWSLFDVCPNEYWRVFKNIEGYKSLYKKLPYNREVFFKKTMGYIPRENVKIHHLIRV